MEIMDVISAISTSLSGIHSAWEIVNLISKRKSDIERREVRKNNDTLITKYEKEMVINRSTDDNFIPLQDRVLLITISPNLLLSIEQRLDKVLILLNEKILQSESLEEIEKERKYSQKQICYFLQVVLDHNNNSFPPGGRLGKLWDEFRCKEIYTQEHN